MKRKIVLVILIIWIAFIFYHSIKTAPESIKESNVIVHNIKSIIITLYNGEVPTDVRSYMDNQLSTTIRNIAHLFEFFVLYILFYINFKYYHMCGIKRLLNGLYAILIVATIDESIQLFSSGRAFQITDLITDLFGGLLALLIVFLISKFIKKDFDVCDV